MRSPGLVVMGVAGLLVVGYAFHTLLSPPAPRGGAGRSREEASQPADDESEDADDEGARKARPRGGKRDPAQRSLPVDPTRRDPAPPPPRPEPAIPLAEARKQFADYMAELDALAARDAQLGSPEWVELYRRGHEVLAPLQQHLDSKIPAQAQELKMANEDMRARLNSIDLSRPDPPPP
jgi:hypothetical protein